MTDAEEMVARSDGWVMPVAGGGNTPTVTDEQFELIRSRFDSRARQKYTPDDIYGFRLIASSNGLDAYMTKQDEDTSLRNFVTDLKRGQAVLGNHDTGSFSYGSSYDGVLEAADPDLPEYEATFYRRHAGDPSLRTSMWTIGDYYIVRGVTLNGQPSDDLIRSIELGGVSKTSISFMVGDYLCSICGKGMAQSILDDAECEHFPGIVYNGQLAWARMIDNDLLETSMVYKNASPSAMLLRRAEDMASRGLIGARQVAMLEERFGRRFPRFERRVFPTGQEVQHMTEIADVQASTEDAEVVEESTALEAPPADPLAAITELSVEGLDDDQQERLSDVIEQIDEQLGERSIRRSIVRLQSSRESALEEALGEPLTVDAIRSLVARASLGDQLYSKRVDEAVAMRIRAQGDAFRSVEKYRDHLIGARDVEYVEEEIRAYESQIPFQPGRQVTPSDVKDTGDKRNLPRKPKAPDLSGQSNLLARK